MKIYTTTTFSIFVNIYSSTEFQMGFGFRLADFGLARFRMYVFVYECVVCIERTDCFTFCVVCSFDSS